MEAVRKISIICLWIVFAACSKDHIITSLADSIQLKPIPISAKIIFHENNLIYAMDEDGRHVTQITFDYSHHLEHVAVSFDRTKIAANYFANPSIGGITSKVGLADFL